DTHLSLLPSTLHLSHVCVLPTCHLPRHSAQSPTGYFFFFKDTATTEIYTLSLHDALPIYVGERDYEPVAGVRHIGVSNGSSYFRSEEHTSELQSLTNLVCRLLLEKKKKKIEIILFAHPNNPNTVP